VNLAVAPAAVELAVGGSGKRCHGTPQTREVAELGDVGLEQLVVDEAPAHGRELSRVGVLDRETGEQQRLGIGRLPASRGVRHDSAETFSHAVEQLERRIATRAQ
jgi:hypothetical protein